MVARTRPSPMIPRPFDLVFFALAVLPGMMLTAHRLGGDRWMTALAVAVPSTLLLIRLAHPGMGHVQTGTDDATGLMLRDSFNAAVEQIFAQTQDGALKSACFWIDLDEVEGLLNQHGQAAIDLVMQRTADRIVGALRPQDRVARIGETRFAICLAPGPHLDLESGLQISARLQSVIEDPVHVDGVTMYLSCCIGFCLRSRVVGDRSDGWMMAARMALADARQNGPSSLRAYTKDMQSRRDVSTAAAQDVISALDRDEFQAWFQPQLNSETGHVSGFEALARWVHPTRGVLPPDQFLPMLEARDQIPRLTEVVLRQSMHALANWDRAGAQVPKVSINLSQQDIADPTLRDTIEWELDRCDLTPDRLCLEILETVVTDTPDDSAVRNLQRLSQLGCSIDLDDYGTGHASIAAIKRFPINRIKIDRSFVMKCDQDPDQQRLVGALLSMAEHLQLETLAEGVETVGEHALLAQLGCGYVQGFGISRPMPFEDTLSWLTQHAAKIPPAPDINRRTV